MGIEKAFKNLEYESFFSYSQFPIKISTSKRGGGKTFAVQKRLLNKYLNKGEFFVVIRESQIEIDFMLQGGFWDKYLIDDKKYSECEFTINGNEIILNGVTIGVCFALSTFGNLRGAVIDVGKEQTKKNFEELEKEINKVEEFTKNNTEKITSLFFDEFIPIKPKMNDQKRLNAFLHTLETIFRFRENIEIFLNGNLTKNYDIFLSEFGFADFKELTYGIKKAYTKPNKDKKIQPLAVWIHIKTNPEWEKIRDNSIVGKITREKENSMFTTGNAFLGGDFKKINGKPLPRFILFNLSDGENNLTFWKTRFNIFYVTERTNNKTFPTYAFDLRKCGIGVKLATNIIQRILNNCIDNDLIEFDNAKSYSIFINMLPNKKINNKGGE